MVEAALYARLPPEPFQPLGVGGVGGLKYL